MLGWAFWVIFWVIIVYILFYLKIVPVQYIVQIYAEQHTGAGCESLNERRSRRVGHIAWWRVWCFA